MRVRERVTLAFEERMNLFERILVLLISGAVTGLTVALPELGFLEWITIIPAAWVLIRRGSCRENKLRSVYFDGLVFFFAYYLFCYHFFLSMYPLDFIEGMSNASALVVVIVAWIGLSLLQASLGAFVFLFSALAFRGRLAQKAEILKPFFAALIWAVFEWSQNFGWWGVPWGKLPLGQTKYIVGIQNASWFGSYFLTFMLVAVNFLIAFAILNIARIKLLRAASTLALSFIAFQYISGAAIWFSSDTSEDETIRVACVQGNISASNQWAPGTIEKLENMYFEQTRAAAQQGAEIVLWPETAMPYDITDGGSVDFEEKFKKLAKETDTYILVGAYSLCEEGGSYNSLLCYTPSGERLDTVYNKRRLVPFGEFVPMRKVFETLIPPLTEILIANEDVAVGKGSQLMDIEGHNVGCLICFDSIYDGLTLESVRDGAELICLSTNDSWFEGSAALNIHNSHAQLRAIESGRYIARSASTGISTVISPKGEVLASLEAEQEGIVLYDVGFRESKTLWQYLGNAFIYLALALLSISVFYEIFLKIKNKKAKNY